MKEWNQSLLNQIFSFSPVEVASERDNEKDKIKAFNIECLLMLQSLYRRAFCEVSNWF